MFKQLKLELRGLYQVAMRTGLLLGFLISIQMDSRASGTSSLRSIYGIIFLTYIATPVPFLF